MEHERIDFKIIINDLADARIAIVAPHGGGIEPGTSELAREIAGRDMRLAIFEGIKKVNNASLHITSTNFDEPRCIEIIEKSDFVLTIHGEDSDKDITYIGGKDMYLRDFIKKALEDAGFKVGVHNNVNLQGISPVNICNRSKRGVGVQLEISEGLRKTFFQSLKSKGRDKPTEVFYRFVNAVRKGLLDGVYSNSSS